MRRYFYFFLFSCLIFAQTTLHTASELATFNMPNLQIPSAYNPAYSDSTSRISTSVRPQLSLKELTIFGLSYSAENVGAEIRALSFDLYSKTEASLFYSHEFTPQLRAGVSATYHHQSVKNYKTKSAINGALSLLYQQNDLTFSLSAFHLLPTDFTSQTAHSSVALQDGLFRYEYHLSYQNELEQVALLSARFADEVAFSAAYHLEFAELAFSLTLSLENYTLNYAVQLHNTLGETHGISLAMRM